MTKDKALEMAIEAMCDFDYDKRLKAIQACKEALAQPAFDYKTAFSHGYEAHKAEREYPTKEEMLNKIFEATYQQHSAKLKQPNEGSITFINNANADWVLRITPSRKIEANKDVEVTEAAQKVLDAIQPLLDKQPAQEPVAHIKQGMDGYPKLVFNGKFEYESISAKWDDIALYTKE